MFREKLRTMGKSSKAKFTKLATMFSRRAPNMGGAGRMLGQAPAPSKDNLLLNAEPLVNCRDSDEESEGEEKHKTTKVIARSKYSNVVNISFVSIGMCIMPTFNSDLQGRKYQLM